VVGTKQDAYLKRGRFEPEQAIDFFTKASAKAQADGFRALRGGAEMSWQLSGDPGSEQLVLYEALLNGAFPHHEVLGICQYNMERFTPEVIKSVLYTHPIAVIGGLVCENPYYKPPKEFFSSYPVQAEVNRMIETIYASARAKADLEERVRELEEDVARLTAGPKPQRKSPTLL
jgi:hypothetical protein